MSDVGAVDTSEMELVDDGRDKSIPRHRDEAMELRVSVQSLIHQLVHEQAKATVNLEGLQRDVTTLLTFREHVLDSLPRLPTPPSEPPWKPGKPPPWKGRDSGFSGGGGSGGSGGARDTMAALRSRPVTTPTGTSTKRPPPLTGADRTTTVTTVTSSSTSPPTSEPTADEPSSSPVSPVSPVSPGSDSGLKSVEGGGGSRWHDAGHSGASGNSTSGVGTSVGAGVSGGTGCVVISSGDDAGGGGGAGRWADGDELLGLLDTIASRGRRLCDENRQLAEVLSHTELSHHGEMDRADEEEERERERDPNVTYRCRYCERPRPAAAGAAGVVDPTRLIRDPVTDALNLNVHLSGQAALGGQSPHLGGQSPLLGGGQYAAGQSPLLGGQSPLLGGQYLSPGGHSPLVPPVGQSPLLHGRTTPLGRSPPFLHPSAAAATAAGGGGDPGCPLSLPVLRPREEYITALTEVERLMQERDLLLERLLGMELVAVRSQGQAASLQTRLQMVSAANEELRRELRLASSSRCEVDARIHDMHQQFVRSRRPQPSPAPAPAAASSVTSSATSSAAATALASRSTPDLRLPSRIPQPLSLRKRSETVGERARGSAEERVGRAAEERCRQTQTERSPFSVDRATQTDPSPSSPPSPSPSSPPARAAGAGAAVPDRARVAGILREMDPLRLQRQLLRMLVEAEVLRSQLSSLGGDPRSGQVTAASSGRPSAAAASSVSSSSSVSELKKQNEELRLQLTERQIELEGARARLRQWESSSGPAGPGPASQTPPGGGRPRAGGAGRPVSLSAGSPHDRSLGHSSIPVLVRSASPATGRPRRLSAGQTGVGGGGGQRSPTPSRLTVEPRTAPAAAVRGGDGTPRARPGRATTSGGRRSTNPAATAESCQTDLATVQAMRQLTWSLRRSTPNLSSSSSSAGQGGGGGTSTAGRTNGLESAAAAAARAAGGGGGGGAVGHMGSTPNLITAGAAGQPPPPGRGVGSSGATLASIRQDPKTKADWRASFPDITAAAANSSSTSASPSASASSAVAATSGRVPPGQSQAIGQILTALSSAGSAPPGGGGGGGSETLARTAADIRALRREMELRLRAARSDPHATADDGVEDDVGDDVGDGVGDGVEDDVGDDVEGDDEAVEVPAPTAEVGGGVVSASRSTAVTETLAGETPGMKTETGAARSRATTAATAAAAPPAPPGRRGGLLERLNALDPPPPPPPPPPMAVDSRFGYRHTGVSRPDPALMAPNQGLIHQILSAHTAAAAAASASPSPGPGAGSSGGPGSTAGSVGCPGPTTGPVTGSAGPTAAPGGRQRLQKSVSLASAGERRQTAAHPRLIRSVTLREGGGSPRPPPPPPPAPAPPAKESGNARVGRYIRSLLQRISEVPDQ